MMQFDNKLYLQWLTPDKWHLSDNEYTLINLCMVVAYDLNETIMGITIFEARNLDQNLQTRLVARKNKVEHIKHKFVIYAPAFLEHKINSLFVGVDITIKHTSFLKLSCNSEKFELRDKLRLLNVDDSSVVLKFFKSIAEKEKYIEIVEQISDPLIAVNTILKFQPDVVTMDIQMPGKTGVEVVKELIDKKYFPIIMVSSVSIEAGTLVFDALNAGAFDYIQKPSLEDKHDFEENLKTKLLLAVDKGQQVFDSKKNRINIVTKANQQANQNKHLTFKDNLLWCIGSSTGGTQALTQIFTSLPGHIPPTVIVQHMPPLFTKAFADNLNDLCPFTVKEAEHGEELQSDHVYIAMGGLQMAIKQQANKLYIELIDDDPVNRFKPSVDYMFNTISNVDGFSIVSGILTGMGNDGAKGLLALKNKNAKTFAQNEESSVVFGMPRVAIELGAAMHIVPLDQISECLLSLSTEFNHQK